MRSLLMLVSVLSLVACEQEVDETDALADVPGCSSEDCVQEGDHTFMVDGLARDVQVWMPEETRGAPVLFVWHHLGGSPEELFTVMPLNTAVDDGFVVVAADSRRLPSSEWDLQTEPSNNPDVALFDAALGSLIEDHGVDAERVYATGFSAGGLFTTFLTMHRADVLAATAPFSGGAPAWSYVTPASDIPVMVTWGGPTDTYGGFDFDDASRNLINELASDGHPVLSCEHSLGHWVPPGATERTLGFFQTHAKSGTVAEFDACERLP